MKITDPLDKIERLTLTLTGGCKPLEAAEAALEVQRILQKPTPIADSLDEIYRILEQAKKEGQP